ncbi:GAF domain-containing sensor histidine kinase [Pyxidicoccus parkwayensis]|uniref:histidine kinase n=1 Tax=Pyxidicoccus parkwayensis TaxID=2813578 RepID=A0ABX7NYY6_9BACT|nr:GAF domain-containing sensor histidine kinase [Pyxidicoccus parkwaysis]QSQ22660.1 GAF domain-containing sensor histidine kinase [Pyxidicoccus parkwaysis]
MEFAHIARELGNAESDTDVIDVIRRAARKWVGCDGVTFVIRDGDECCYVDEDAIGPLFKGRRFPLTACVSGWCMMNGRLTVIPDVFADPRVPTEAYAPTFVKSMAMVPVGQGQVSAAIGAYWQIRFEPTNDQLARLESLATVTASCLQNIALRRSLERQVAERTVELRAANTQLQAFAATVAHDLRNLIQVVRSSSNWLASETLPDEQHEAAQDIHAAAERMNDITESLIRLHFAKVGGLAPRQTDLSAVSEDIIRAIRARHGASSVESHVEPGLVFTVDEGLMRVALTNLLENAWKFVVGRPGARVAVARGATPASLVVEDNGIGFDTHSAPKLFEPFVRLPSASSYAGTGLGLATVLNIIHRHGGTIRAEGKSGVGARFIIELPERSSTSTRAALDALD